MEKIRWISTLFALGLTGLVWNAGAQPQLPGQEISAAAGLQTEVQRLVKQQRGPFWVGYEVSLAPGIGGICCAPGAPCSLKKSEQVFQSEPSAHSPHLDLRVFLQIQQGQIKQIRSLTSDCPLDTASLRLFWMRGVGAKESVGLLSSLASSPETALSAIFAIGAHADKSADEALSSLVASGSPEVRQHALARIGNARGIAGFDLLREQLFQAGDAKIRQQVLFAIAMSHEPEAEEVLLRAAREDRDVEVRSRALVLYSGQAGLRALPVLSEVIAHDPLPEVRSSAVFALGHIPEDARRSALETVTKENSDPEVRRQAQLMLDRMDGHGPQRPPSLREGRFR